MLHQLLAVSPRELGKYLAYALILLAPGSFVLLPLAWLIKLIRAQAARRIKYNPDRIAPGETACRRSSR